MSIKSQNNLNFSSTPTVNMKKHGKSTQNLNYTKKLMKISNGSSILSKHNQNHLKFIPTTVKERKSPAPVYHR